MGRVLLLSLVLLLAGCSGTSSSLLAPDGTFSLTPKEAEAVLLRAIAAEFPDKDPIPLDDGRLGFHFNVWWLLDHDRITVQAIPQGENRFAFRVDNQGTAPAAGDPARERLMARLLEEAGRASASSGP
ncbi:hypothetical protein [Ferrimonas balearica]|uniref:hypothetical protein n=1 Tax=Ferrimonas balearica TaxID=44012 RepID=UPI001C9A135A|nr:hypothetical protein [Ferrimonas balearica]MBY5993162.1 hypothetical protein [Ferrimonas balearica]